MSEIATPQWLHNWLYSVVPVAVKQTDTAWQYESSGASTSITQIDYPLFPYLTGYCRNCGRAFSQRIPSSDYGYIETQMSVAKFGCVGPEGA